MIQKVRRIGNNYVVTIPQDEMEQQGIAGGDLEIAQVHKVTETPQTSLELRAAFERSWQSYTADYDYLKGR
ncbi:MAG TPA: hypothetical protein VF510_06460 [Ktedonobacterales bacterium]